MNTKELKYFLEVCEAGNIKNAAEKLYITPQGLSKVMRNLETELGVMLFIRSNNGILLTECGRILKGKAGHMMQEMEDILYDMDRMKNDSNSIRLACSYGALEVFSPHRILDFMKHSPDIHMEWKEYLDAGVEQAISRNQADYGIIVGKVNTHILEQRLLCSSPIYLSVRSGHPLYSVQEIHFSMLNQENIISPNRDSAIYQDFWHRCQREKVAPNIVFETTKRDFAKELCSYGIGAALMVEDGSDDMAAAELKMIPFADAEFQRRIYLIWKKDRNPLTVFFEFEKFISDLIS